MTNMSQKYSVVVLDEAIHAEAQEIVWKPENKDEYSGIVLQIRAFHIIRAFLSIIGKRFQGAGLDDLLVESGVVSNGSIAGVMAGKHYNRAVYAHKITYEALLRALGVEFEENILSLLPKQEQDNFKVLADQLNALRVEVDECKE